MLITALSDGYRSNIHLSFLVILCMSLSRSLSNYLSVHTLILSAMTPSMRWCFIRFWPSHCLIVRHVRFLMKSLI